MQYVSKFCGPVDKVPTQFYLEMDQIIFLTSNDVESGPLDGFFFVHTILF